MPTDWSAPLTLEGRFAHLVPLAPEHAEALESAIVAGQLHRLWTTRVPAPGAVDAEIERRLALQRAGTMLPFTVLDARDLAPVGMTTYMNIDRANRRVEIGSTWYARSAQRTGINTDCKRMLLEHAFETLECHAVEFRTHFMNVESRRAIERLGAKLDGILRAHMAMPDGSLRDTAVYSIIASEWPAVRSNRRWLAERRGRSGTPRGPRLASGGHEPHPRLRP